MEIFLELTTIVIFATILAIIMRLLKQPLVIGYILTGILVGPHFFDLIHSKEYIELFSKIGITILLFLVGLNLSPKIIKEVGKVSLIGGLAQIGITAVLGFILATALGIPIISSLYIAISLAFSSTIIILKILSDTGELAKINGKISIGFLLIQDLVAICILIIISSLAGAGAGDIGNLLVVLVAKALGLAFVIYIVTSHIFPKAIPYFAASQELLFLFSITWGFAVASIFYVLGFSIEVGALIAGITLSVTPFADGIASRLRPLRDFFLVLFFILLGSEMKLDTFAAIIFPAIILSTFVLLGKPIIVFLLMNLLGYKKRPAFQVGVALAQISEFSLILLALGLHAGHVPEAVVSLVTLVGLITIAGSSYLMLSSDKLYEFCKPLLGKLEIKKNNRTKMRDDSGQDLILFGYDNVGRDFIEAFAKLEKDYIVVDLNPVLIQQMEENAVPFKYGDVEDIDFLEELPLKDIKLCVSTIPTFKANTLLIKKIREVNETAIILVRCHEMDEAKKLYELGASYVIMPHYLGAKYASKMIERLGLDTKGFAKEKEKHLAHVHKG